MPSPIHLDNLLTWEQRFSQIYRTNPYESPRYSREKRQLERDLRENNQLLTSTQERFQLVSQWLESYTEIGRNYPSVWQSFFLGLVRFLFDAQDPTLNGQRLQQTWGRVELLGQRAQVPDYQELMEIAEKARRVGQELHHIRGQSSSLRQFKKQIWSACFGVDLYRLLFYNRILQELNVLIQGPTGSGKELVARVLLAASAGEWQDAHNQLLRWVPHPTESINLAEFPRELMAAQIVGYRKGAFTGANQDFHGILSRCHEGSVFLDEIGELSEEGQVVLLRVLETKQVRPLGAETVDVADCRVITASHKPLTQEDTSSFFRRDLYYRLAGAVIHVPPLSERREDLLPIALGFLDEWGVRDQASLHLEDPRHRISEWLATDAVRNYTWPGNVRELKRAVAQILIGREHHEIQQSYTQTSLPSYSSHSTSGLTSPIPSQQLCPTPILEGRWSLHELKQWYIQHVLELHDGNQQATAKQLNIHRTTIYHALKKQEKQTQSNGTK